MKAFKLSKASCSLCCSRSNGQTILRFTELATLSPTSWLTGALATRRRPGRRQRGTITSLTWIDCPWQDEGDAFAEAHAGVVMVDDR